MKLHVRYNDKKAICSSVKMNDEVLIMIEGKDIEIGDQYHTMHDLYQHRMALNIALFNIAYNDTHLREDGWRILKSKLHHDGTMFEGDYFIVMMVTPIGQISYHYKMKHWDKFKIVEYDKAPEWDGHSSLDVMERLMQL